MNYDNIRELSYEMSAEIQAIYKLFTPKGRTMELSKLDDLVQGAFDTHMHPAPDAYAARPYDDLQLAIEACKIGMGGVVFKCHSFPSARGARIAQRVVDEWAKEHGKTRTLVFGGAVLNRNIGGLNPEAVESVVGLGGRFIWTPNLDSSHHRKLEGHSGGIEVVGADNRVTKDFAEILRLVAKHDLVLSITHHSTKERFIMIDAAREAGVNRIEVCHPNAPSAKMSIDQMKHAASKGAYLGLYCVNFAPPLFSLDEMLEAIRVVGPERIVLGTDLGNWVVPPPAGNFRILLGLLYANGVSEKDINMMAKENPRALILK